MALAVEQVRRMRGGAQSHLMRCSNQAYYVVKFQNNPQGLRILANTNGRQAIFFREADGAGRGAGAATRYCARMIDNGFCFNAAEWNFPDAPLRGLYARHRVYESVRGMDSFEAWIARVERIEETALEKIYGEIPPEWYDCDADALERMLEQLLRRRNLVRELIVSAWKSSAQPFPNWK
jgi:hypothetical protein